MVNDSKSGNALNRFVEKIDFTKLKRTPEDFYKAGRAFIENGQFDEGIQEFVKVVKTSSINAPSFGQAVKELKSKGFSSADISAITSISESEIDLKFEYIPTHAESNLPPQNILPSTFWNNRKQKLSSIFYVVLAVFIFTLPYSLSSIFIIPILWFPVGLIGLVFDLDNYSPPAVIPFVVISLLWIIYLGLAITIVSNNKKKVVSRIYIVLILLLILNIIGCHAVGPYIMEGVH